MPVNYIESRKTHLQINLVTLNIECIKGIIIDAHDAANHLVYIHLENVPNPMEFYHEDANDLIAFLKINEDDLNIHVEYINSDSVDV
jgi:hypothetical protein